MGIDVGSTPDCPGVSKNHIDNLIDYFTFMLSLPVMPKKFTTVVKGKPNRRPFVVEFLVPTSKITSTVLTEFNGQ